MVDRLSDALAPVDEGAPGKRMFGAASVAEFVGAGTPLVIRLAELTGLSMHPVRAILFDKSAERNWALGWHQDRVIAVGERRKVAGYGPWTRKQGSLHVAPPVHLLERMITIRIHLDEVGSYNAPLLIAPGSHLAGVVPEEQIDAIVQRHGVHSCTAKRADVWIYRTLILHASERAMSPRRRRVLQVDYSPDRLAGGLEWTGIA